MILKKKLKAGILLQAIVLAAVFTLVLQFYLARILATERQYHSQIEASKAYLTAQLAYKTIEGDSISGNVILQEDMLHTSKKGTIYKLRLHWIREETITISFIVKQTLSKYLSSLMIIKQAINIKNIQ